MPHFFPRYYVGCHFLSFPNQIIGENQKEWFRPTLWQNEGSKEVLINVMVNDFWFTLARVEDVQIYAWQHICFEIDTVGEKVSVARNGKILGSDIAVAGIGVNKPANVQANLVLGLFVDESLTSQFCGQVTNINIYSRKGGSDLVDLTSKPCKSEGDILSWNSTSWADNGTAASWEEADETVNPQILFIACLTSNCRRAPQQQCSRWPLT